MFKLISFERRLCALGSSYEFIADACRNKDEFFSFVDYRPWRGFSRGYVKADTYFYLYYWFVLMLGLGGTARCLYNFAVLFLAKEVNISSTMWHKNRFHVVPPAYVRRWNLVKGFIQINAWMLLLYAGFFVSPPHMYPWLLVRVLKLISKVMGAIFDYILGRLEGQRISTTFNLIVSALTTWLVRQAMHAFAAARKQDIV